MCWGMRQRKALLLAGEKRHGDSFRNSRQKVAKWTWANKELSEWKVPGVAAGTGADVGQPWHGRAGGPSVGLEPGGPDIYHRVRPSPGPSEPVCRRGKSPERRLMGLRDWFFAVAATTGGCRGNDQSECLRPTLPFIPGLQMAPGLEGTPETARELG